MALSEACEEASKLANEELKRKGYLTKAEILDILADVIGIDVPIPTPADKLCGLIDFDKES